VEYDFVFLHTHLFFNEALSLIIEVLNIQIDAFIAYAQLNKIKSQTIVSEKAIFECFTCSDPENASAAE
jgi:hypothetical protein